MYNAASDGGPHGKGFLGHADSVFNEKQGRDHCSTLLYAQTRLLQSSFSTTDTVHIAEDTSESAFIRHSGAHEIVTGSPQNSAYMYIYACYEVIDFSSHDQVTPQAMEIALIF